MMVSAFLPKFILWSYRLLAYRVPTVFFKVFSRNPAEESFVTHPPGLWGLVLYSPLPVRKVSTVLTGASREPESHSLGSRERVPVGLAAPLP